MSVREDEVFLISARLEARKAHAEFLARHFEGRGTPAPHGLDPFAPEITAALKSLLAQLQAKVQEQVDGTEGRLP